MPRAQTRKKSLLMVRAGLGDVMLKLGLVVLTIQYQAVSLKYFSFSQPQFIRYLKSKCSSVPLKHIFISADVAILFL